MNADDLGVCRGVNEGVAAAAESGLVKNASLCVTGDAVEEGVRVAKRHQLSVGLHFSLTLGRSLSGPIRGVTDCTGRFFPLRRLLRNCLVGAVNVDSIRAELQQQWRRAVELGICPTHFDGHQHVHVFPLVRDALAAIPPAIPIRVPVDRSPVSRRWASRLIVAALSSSFAARDTRHRFIGMALYDARRHRELSERVLDDLARACIASFEWMVHPRFGDGSFEVLNHRSPGSLRYADRELETLRSAWLAEVFRDRRWRSVAR